MLPQEEEAAAGARRPQHPSNTNDTSKRALRANYLGVLLFNIAAFTLPALVGTLSKL